MSMENDWWSTANSASACRQCVQVARRLETRFCVMRSSARRWDRYVEQMQQVIKRLEFHLKWDSYSSAPDVCKRLCVLADQAAPFDAVIAFELNLLAADILYYVCHHQVMCADALQRAANTIYGMSESKAMLLVGKASDMYEHNGAYRKAIDAERLALEWAERSASALPKMRNVMRLRRERIEKLRRMDRFFSD